MKTSLALGCFTIATKCEISGNSCQDLGFSWEFPLPLETLDKILKYLGPWENLEFFCGDSYTEIQEVKNSN